MFKYCVWYIVKDTHPVYKNMIKYSSLFKTHIFPPHITIASKLTKSEAISTYNRYLSVEKPSFSPSSDPIISCEQNFYAIEQPLSTNGKYVEGIHISMAYRLDKTFTPMELAHIEIIPRIYPDDLSLCIMNCWAENPNEWIRDSFQNVVII